MPAVRIFRIAPMFLLVIGLACGDDEPAGPATSFSAELSGDEEVPAVTTDATG